MSAIDVFRASVNVLLYRHYGMGLADTSLAKPGAAEACLARGERPFEAVNAYAASVSLGRIDRALEAEELSREPLTSADETPVVAQVRDDLDVDLAVA